MTQDAPAASRERRRVNPIFLATAIAAIVWGVLSIRNATRDGPVEPEHADAPRADAAVEMLDVRYRVTGSAASARITFAAPAGGTSQTEAKLPWEHRYSVPADAKVRLYASAQNQGEYGDLIVSIVIDGKIVQASRADGAYSIANVSL